MRKQLSTKAFLPLAYQPWRLEVVRKAGAGLGQEEESEGKASAGNKLSDKPRWQRIWHC